MPAMKSDETEVKQQLSNVLVVPYHRFEFHTEYPIEEIAKQNGIDKSLVFNMYQGKLLSTLAEYRCEHYRFRIINAANLDYLQRRVSYEAERKPVNYYASNLGLLQESDLQRIMNTYDAEYILFLNLYSIRKETIIGIGRGESNMPFSSHLMDFDLYDASKQKLLWAHKFEIPPLKTSESIGHKGLRVTDLTTGFEAVAAYVCEQMAKEE